MERVLIRATCRPNTEAEMTATATSSRRAGLSVRLSEVCEFCPFVILFPFWVVFCSTQLATDSGQQLDCWGEIGVRKFNYFVKLLDYIVISCQLSAVCCQLSYPLMILNLPVV